MKNENNEKYESSQELAQDLFGAKPNQNQESPDIKSLTRITADISLKDDFSSSKSFDRFELSYDDSSSEDDIEKVKKYDIKGKLKNFLPVFKDQKENYKLSFMSHALGLEVFYSEAVQKRYYELKRKYLTHKFDENFRNNLRQQYAQAIESAIKFFLCGDEYSENKIINNLSTEFLKTHQDLCNKILELLYDNNRDIFKFKDKFDLGIINAEIEKLQSELKNFKIAKINKETINKKGDLLNYPDLFAVVKTKLEEEARRILLSNNCLTTSKKKVKCDSITKKNIKNTKKKFKKILLERVKYNETSHLTIEEFLTREKLYEKLGLLLYKKQPMEKADLIYILFGCEAVRNPTCLIHHQMMLDLIISGKYDFKDFFTDKNAEPIIPMEVVDAARCSRTTQIFYNRYMPVHYIYPKEGYGLSPDDSKFQKFLEREANLTKKWVKAVYKDKGESYSIIKDKLHGWYSWLKKEEKLYNFI